MTSYSPETLCWDASGFWGHRTRETAIPPLVRWIQGLSFSTSSVCNTRFDEAVIERKNSQQDDVLLFMMQHSQQAFAEIWDDPAEDIWDSL